jgi:putative Ca2+/H+ antiporter (TMEM165/GDT1 family)
LAGGAIMIGYGIWSFLKTNQEKDEITAAQRKLSAKGSTGLTSMFLSIVAMLVLLDLAGDATELLTILFVARFQDPLMVFTAAVAALIAATAVETTIGSTMSKILSTHRIRIFSLAVFLIIGTSAILSVVFHV